MSFIKTISLSDIKDVGILFRAALDRIPILIKGENNDSIEDFINGIIKLLPFRNYSIYYNDFTTKFDHEELVQNEEIDYWIQRNLFISYPYSFQKLIENIEIYTSWVIGIDSSVSESSDEMKKFNDFLYLDHERYLIINLHEDKFTSNLYGRNFSNIDLSFEKWVYTNAIQNTEKSIEKMKRIIAKGIKNDNISEKDLSEIMSFSIEGEQLKENLIVKELSNFYEACKRGFSILNRIKILESLDLKISLSKRTLDSTIAYKHATISRILDFIKAEWNLSFDGFFDTKKLSNYTDTFESLWG